MHHLNDACFFCVGNNDIPLNGEDNSKKVLCWQILKKVTL